MATKEEIIDYAREESNLDSVVEYLSGADLSLKNLEDVLLEVQEPRITGVRVLNAATYHFQVLKRTLGERAKIENPEISWKELCVAYLETGHNVQYFL